MRAFLSFLSLYRYNQGLFDEFIVPESVDKNLVVNNILLEIGELEVVYPNYDFMKQALKFYSQKQLPVWQALEESLHYEYDPIENYNRVEKWTDTGTGNRTNTLERTQTGKGKDSSTIKNDTSGNNTGDNTTTNSVSAYNSSGFEPQSESINTSSENLHTTTNGSTATSSETSGTLNDNGTETHNESNVREGIAKGNIGVTTTQEMIKQQREIVEFNIVDKIVEDVKNRFCLGVW